MNGYDLLEYVLGTHNDTWANNKSSSTWNVEYKVEPGYNDTSLCDSLTVSDILRCQLIPLYVSVITTTVDNNKKYSVPYMTLQMKWIVYGRTTKWKKILQNVTI